MKKKSFAALLTAFILCFGLSTAAVAVEDDIFLVTYNPTNVNFDIVFKTVNPNTMQETAISGETVSANTATSVLEMLIVPKTGLSYKMGGTSIAYDPEFFAIATVGGNMVKATGSPMSAINNVTDKGGERNVLIANLMSAYDTECPSGSPFVTVYLNPLKSIPVTELKDHISLVALNEKSATVYNVPKCSTIVANNATETQYIFDTLTYFPSAVTATYDNTEVSKKATVAQVEETISLSNTYNVSGEAVTDFTLYTDEACTNALTDGGLQVGSNTLWVKTAFGGKTSVTVTALDTAGEDFQTVLDQLAEDSTYQVTEDLNAPTTDLVLSNGKMLDLNGKTLKVKSLTLNSGAIIGGEGKLYGDLITSSTTLTPSFTGTNGGWMPIKRTDSDGKYYAFEDVSATGIETKKEEKTKENTETSAASQLAGIFTLHDFFKDNMEDLVNEDNNYTFTLSVTVTTTAETVDFTQVDAEDQAINEDGPVQKNVVDGKVTFEMELNDAIKAALLDGQDIESVYALVKKTGSLTITDMTYELNIHNELFAKSSGTILLGAVGFNWLGFGS